MDGCMKDHRECLEEFKEIAEAESDNRQRWLEDLKFGYADDQWDEKLRRMRQNDPNGPRPCLTVNKIPAHARQILNDMRQSRPSIKCLPVDDKADIETAEILQGIIRHIEHVSNAEQAYSIATEYQVMMGVGYFRVTTAHVDPIFNEQEIRIQAIRNPFSVYIDPWITDITGGDARVCFITTKMPRKEFRKQWPKAREVDMDNLGVGDKSGWWSEDAVKVAEYFYLEDATETYLVLDSGLTIPVARYDAERDGPYQREAEVPKKQLYWKLLTGAEVLEESEKVGEFIPVIRVAGEDIDIDGERITHGIVRRARDAQNMYNYTVSAEAETNALAPKAPWLVADESIEGFEDEFAAANVSNMPYLRYRAMDDNGNPLPPPQRQFPTGANAAILSQKQAADGDIQATIGQFAASLGQPSNEKSGIAIRQRQQVGDIATYHYPDNLSRAIRQCGRVIIDLIPHIYDTPRIARILGEDGDVDTVRIDPGIRGAYEERGKERIYNLGVGKYDIAVDVGPSYATKRQEAFEAMAQMTQGNPQLWGIIGDLLVKNMDWPGAQEMAKRLKATVPPEIRQDEEEDMDPEVAQAFQQVEQAMQAQGEQMQALMQQNQELQQTIQGKVIEQEMKSQEHAMKMAELEQERAIKQMEFEQKQAELVAKQEEAAQKMAMQAEKNITDSASMMELVQVAATSSAETQQILAALAQATQQQGEMLAAMLQEMTKPKRLAVEMDENGNVIGGVAQTLQ